MNKCEPILLENIKKNPLVSVIIANYNHEDYIDIAIESVLSQTYNNLEVVICDDGSEDNSVDVIKQYSEQYENINLIEQENEGQASAYNTAYRNSSGYIISILDADDEFMCSKLEKVVNYFGKYINSGFIGHYVQGIDEDNNVLKKQHPNKLDEGWLCPLMFSNKLPRLPPASGISIRKEIARIVFPLPPKFIKKADCVLRLRSAIITEAHNIDMSLAKYRQHSTNITGIGGSIKSDNLKSEIIYKKKILRDVYDFLNDFHSLSITPEFYKNSNIRKKMLAINLLERNIISKQKIEKLTNNLNKRVIWKFLYKLPRRISIRLFKWWYGSQGPSKRFVRKIAKMLNIKL